MERSWRPAVDWMLNQGLRLARYNSDGSLDTTFGVGGKVTNGVDANSLAVQSDGKIVVGTSPIDSIPDVALIRYNNDGSLDTTFGTAGYASGTGASALAFQPDGKIVAVVLNLLARYNSPLPIMTIRSGTCSPWFIHRDVLRTGHDRRDILRRSLPLSR